MPVYTSYTTRVDYVSISAHMIIADAEFVRKVLVKVTGHAPTSTAVLGWVVVNAANDCKTRESVMGAGR